MLVPSFYFLHENSFGFYFPGHVSIFFLSALLTGKGFKKNFPDEADTHPFIHYDMESDR